VSDEEVSCKSVSEIFLLFQLEDKENCVTVFVNCWTKTNVEHGRVISYFQFCNFLPSILFLFLFCKEIFISLHLVAETGCCNFLNRFLEYFRCQIACSLGYQNRRVTKFVSGKGRPYCLPCKWVLTFAKQVNVRSQSSYIVQEEESYPSAESKKWATDPLSPLAWNETRIEGQLTLWIQNSYILISFLITSCLLAHLNGRKNKINRK